MQCYVQQMYPFQQNYVGEMYSEKIHWHTFTTMYEVRYFTHSHTSYVYVANYCLVIIMLKTYYTAM